MGAPPPYSGKGPKVHGHKFKLADPSTWRARCHFRGRRPKWGRFRFNTGSSYTSVWLLLIQSNPRIAVSGKRTTKSSPNLCGWVGWKCLLEQTWRCYLRRFAVDHWNRFAKQRLHWTLPHFGTTGRTLSDLMPLLSWLWLAREIVKDPLPWQKQQTDLTPGRVAQGFQHF